MSQKVINNNQSIFPFFSERMNFIRGLDPLGLQNTSDSTFSLLLPGLNNVTGRIRYYSFYSWLLDEYSKQLGNTNPEEQRKFIRKAEYIIALCSQFYPEERGNIPGSNYAKLKVQNKDSNTFSLKVGTYNSDGTTANTYWKYSWGAFGQYYLGSMRDIGIIIDREVNGGVYARTSINENNIISGEELAEAFDTSIQKDKKKLFFNCLTKGFISEDEIADLLPDFNLTSIIKNSEEQKLLIRLLLQKDFPYRIEEAASTHRKESIYHLLNFIKDEPEQLSDRQFVYSAYTEKGLEKREIKLSLFGWYYYQFNEYWQYANTSILNGTLSYLESNHGPNWVSLQDFISNCSKLICDVFIENGLSSSDNTQIKDIIKNIDSSEYELYSKTAKDTMINKVCYGFLLMFSQFKNNKEELVQLKEYGERFGLAKDGEGAGYFLKIFQSKLELPLMKYISEYLFKNIIYRHQYVAFKKIRGGGLSTQKFIIEDHHIRYLGNFEASYTGPRIGNLISFLKDLHIISEEDKLTTYGQDILTQISPSND